MCNILVYCEGMDFNVTGIKFMTVFYHGKGCGMLLARVIIIIIIIINNKDWTL